MDRIKTFFCDDQTWFYTLTEQTDDQTPILKHWKTLREGPLDYYYHGVRGIWVLEKTKRGKDHLHALMTRSLDIGWLRDAWYKVTGTSWEVKSRPTTDVRNPAGYMLKYITKQHNGDHLFKKGTRRYGFFGARAPPVPMLGWEDPQPDGEFELGTHFNTESSKWHDYYNELQKIGGPAFISWMDYQTASLLQRVKIDNAIVNIEPAYSENEVKICHHGSNG